jgi:hypothetical protein
MSTDRRVSVIMSTYCTEVEELLVVGLCTEEYVGVVPDSGPGSCLNPELPGTGPESGALGGGGQAETASSPTSKNGDGSRDPAQMEAAESAANRLKTL